MNYQICLVGLEKACYARRVQSDRAIGQNLQELRGDMSQAALAAAMKERGWKWSQPTVAAIEKGERSLKLAEAADLLEVLQLEDLESLILRPLSEVGSIAITRMVKANVELQEAVKAFWHAQFGLVDIADAINVEGAEHPAGVDFWTELITLDPVEVVERVPPFVPMTPEAIERLADWQNQHAWAHRLASGPYGRASRKTPDGATTYPAE